MLEKDQRKAMPKTSGKLGKRASVVNIRKTRRNDPCPCGQSGKKFKNCCMTRDEVSEQQIEKNTKKYFSGKPEPIERTAEMILENRNHE